MENKSHVENSAIKMSRYVKISQVSQALTHKTQETKIQLRACKLLFCCVVKSFEEILLIEF